MKRSITQDDVLKILDSLYEKSIDGIPMISRPIEEMANDYLSKNHGMRKATKAMLRNQVTKCTTSGIIAGFGGLVTLSIAIPANLSSVLYVQMRMIACTAYIAGYDLRSDQTQTFVYACLAGVSLNQVAKEFGIKFGNKVANAMVKKIPGTVLTKINQKIGFRFITKFGEKGLINLGKLVPIAGAAISGSMDGVETRIIANRAYRQFIEDDFTPDKHEDVIDSDFVIS